MITESLTTWQTAHTLKGHNRCDLLSQVHTLAVTAGFSGNISKEPLFRGATAEHD